MASFSGTTLCGSSSSGSLQGQQGSQPFSSLTCLADARLEQLRGQATEALDVALQGSAATQIFNSVHYLDNLFRAELSDSLNAKIAFIREEFLSKIDAAVDRFGQQTKPIAAQTEAVAAELDAAFQQHREKLVQVAAAAGML